MPLPVTVDAFVPSNFGQFFLSAKFQPNQIGLSELRKLDNALSVFKPSLQLAEKLYSPWLLNHCLRTYYFGLAILHNGFPSNTPSVAQTPSEAVVKQLYLASVMHDFGLSTHKCAVSHPAHDMSFEFGGGIMAYEHLRTEYAPHQQLTDFQIANITQSIMLHPVAFEQGQSSPVAMLTHLGAFLDVYGYGALGPDSMDSLIHRDTVREIERAFPRLDMNEMTVTFGTMLKGKPDSFFAHFLHERQLLGDGSVADTH